MIKLTVGKAFEKQEKIYDGLSKLSVPWKKKNLKVFGDKYGIQLWECD